MLQSRCAGCDRPGAVLCRACRFALVAASRSRSVESTGTISAVVFAGRARDVVLGYKYRNRREVAGHLAGLLVNRVLLAGVRPDDLDVVTWVPTSARRRRRRGFDQAELVARTAARQLGVPCRRLLVRDGADLPQTGRSRVERLHGPVFRARPDVHGRRVLLVDDVVTTGATLRGAAGELRAAGAADVVPAAVAATPDRPTVHADVLAGPWGTGRRETPALGRRSA
jgi:ComF family protein